MAPPSKAKPRKEDVGQVKGRLRPESYWQLQAMAAVLTRTLSRNEILDRAVQRLYQGLDQEERQDVDAWLKRNAPDERKPR